MSNQSYVEKINNSKGPREGRHGTVTNVYLKIVSFFKVYTPVLYSILFILFKSFEPTLNKSHDYVVEYKVGRMHDSPTSRVTMSSIKKIMAFAIQKN